ncbi:MAG: hypothetical protein A2381_17725 [Bdellovibrionales bacterium RIFOXYB1_FULL_37_110]|nr:MAG: hypothetical protein A2417_08515 [Bdellovibrionales bacterium RIFOXYC1_FULL_37_79]OFZ59812.1 MAG: hypothetical protein A2381_17725 [Bdellovibrionales bacterium RIFOXYB1_FULL_37_110]
MINIIVLKGSHAEAYAKHLMIHAKESGIDGNTIHYPLSKLPNADNTKIEKCKIAWNTKPGIVGWSRVWGLLVDEEIVGHIRLKGESDLNEIHRCDLSIGLIKKFRRSGWGSRLMETAITWAREQEFLYWVDLNTSVANKSALNLYKKFGFEEVGITKDRFRVQGERIDDVHMVLDLKNENYLNR